MSTSKRRRVSTPEKAQFCCVDVLQFKVVGSSVLSHSLHSKLSRAATVAPAYQEFRFSALLTMIEVCLSNSHSSAASFSISEAVLQFSFTLLSTAAIVGSNGPMLQYGFTLSAQLCSKNLQLNLPYRDDSGSRSLSQ